MHGLVLNLSSGWLYPHLGVLRRVKLARGSGSILHRSSLEAADLLLRNLGGSLLILKEVGHALTDMSELVGGCERIRRVLRLLLGLGHRPGLRVLRGTGLTGVVLA